MVTLATGVTTTCASTTASTGECAHVGPTARPTAGRSNPDMVQQGIVVSRLGSVYFGNFQAKSTYIGMPPSS